MLGKSWQTWVALFTFAAIEVAELQRSIFEQCEFYFKILPLSFPTVRSYGSSRLWVQMPWSECSQMSIFSFNLVLDDIIFESRFKWDSLSKQCFNGINVDCCHICPWSLNSCISTFSNALQCPITHATKTFKCRVAVTYSYVTGQQFQLDMKWN